MSDPSFPAPCPEVPTQGHDRRSESETRSIPGADRRAADLGGRRLIDLRPDDWLRFVTGRTDIRCLERMEGSFQWVGRETDVLLRVQDQEEGEFLVVIELQLRPDPRMALRLGAYAALAEEKFGLPVFAVAVIILPGGPAAMERYHSTVLGLEAHRDFRILRLWEYDAREAAAAGVIGLLPLVPVMRGGDDLKLLAGVRDRLRGSPDLPGMENLLAYFAGLVVGREPMLQLMRWDMETATGMTFYEEILTKGIEQGRAEGVARGMALGVVLHVLNRRFGQAGDDLAPLIEHLDREALERLSVLAEEAPDLAAVRAGLDAALA